MDWQLAKIHERMPPFLTVSVGDDTYTVEESKTQVYDRTHGTSVDDLATMNNLAEGPLLDVLLCSCHLILQENVSFA